jgi:hypothetical protein
MHAYLHTPGWRRIVAVARGVSAREAADRADALHSAAIAREADRGPPPSDRSSTP